MATFTKISDFVEAGMEQQFDFVTTPTISVALSNTAPSGEAPDPTTTGNGILANVTQISYTNYTDSLAVDRVLESVTSVEATGTWTFDAADFTITASGGAIATWRYLYIFDEDSATPTDQLIGVWDHGSAIDLATGETANININASGLITIA